jgi:hypothetical protein
MPSLPKCISQMHNCWRVNCKIFGKFLKCIVQLHNDFWQIFNCRMEPVSRTDSCVARACLHGLTTSDSAAFLSSFDFDHIKQRRPDEAGVLGSWPPNKQPALEATPTPTGRWEIWWIHSHIHMMGIRGSCHRRTPTSFFLFYIKIKINPSFINIYNNRSLQQEDYLILYVGVWAKRALTV